MEQLQDLTHILIQTTSGKGYQNNRNTKTISNTLKLNCYLITYLEFSKSDDFDQVNYKASEENGFEILPGSTILANQPDVAPLPRDSVAVQKAKAQHEALYQEIYASHQANPVPYPIRVLQETKAVQKKRNEFANEYQRIAAEHARIEAEHAAIAAEQARLDPDYVDYTQTK